MDIEVLVNVVPPAVVVEVSPRQGPAGPRGLQGDKGDDGDKGDKGDQGEPGTTPATSEGGNGSADAGKVAKFDSTGALKAFGLLTKSPILTEYGGIGPNTVFFVNAAGKVFSITANITADRQVVFQDVSGNNVVTGRTDGVPDSLAIDAMTAKASLVDADAFPLADSEASGAIKKTLWSTIKAALATYFDTFYAAIGHTHPVYNGLTMLQQRVKQWVLAGTNSPYGTVVLDSGNTANNPVLYNYTHNTYPISPFATSGDYRAYVNFDRTFDIAMDIALFNLSGAAVGWFVCGEAYNQSAVGDPSKKGFGFKLTTSGIALWCHNGSGLTVGAATAVAADESIHIVTLHYASGTLTGTLDGVALASAGSGPTGYSAANQNCPSFQAKTGATNERCRWAIYFPQSRVY